MSEKPLNLYVDLETSGLYPDKHVILAIGAVADISLKSTISFSCLVKPTQEQWDAASPEALHVNGLTWDRFEGAPTLQEAMQAFAGWLMGNDIADSGYGYVGQNPKFDIGFLQQHMGQRMLRFIGFPLSMVYDNRDIYSLLNRYRLIGNIEKRSSEKISEVLGLEPEPFPHDALEGARAVRRSYVKMRSILKEHMPAVMLPYKSFA